MNRALHGLAVFVTTALVAATLAASPSHAKPTWQPVTNLFADVSQGAEPSVAVDPAGNATVLWSRWHGTGYVVQSAVRLAGGTWGAPEDLSDGDGRVSTPRLAVDPVGNATAIWRRYSASGSAVQAATRPAGGTWTTPVDLSIDPAPGYGGDEVPHIAVDAVGNATAIWSHVENNRYTVQSSTRPVDGTWTAPVGLSTPDQNARTAQLCLDPAGNATAIWERSIGESLWVVTTATRPAGGVWSSPSDLSDPSLAIDNPELAVDQAGNVTAAWGHFNGANYVIRAATRAAGAAWTTSVDLSAKGQDSPDGPQIGLDAHGNTTVIWERHDGNNWIATAATRVPGGVWTAPVDISDPGEDALDSQIAIDPAGSATATWVSVQGAERAIQAATRPTGGTWSAPIVLSQPGGNPGEPQIAVDPLGNATTAWSRYDGTNRIVQARGLDAAGPVVTDLVSPTTGSTGQTLTYSVSAHDVWSTVSSVLWDFGDGTTAIGTSVTHQRAKNPTRRVKVTLTDAVGNTTTCTTAVSTCISSTRTVPVITRARITPAKIRAAGSRTKASKKASKKAMVIIGLTTDAKVRLAFRRVGGGKKIQLMKKLKSGKNIFRVSAALARNKTLRPGRYTITVSAKNADGTSPTKKLKLRVVR